MTWEIERSQPPFTDDPALAALTDEQLDALAEVIVWRLASKLRSSREVALPPGTRTRFTPSEPCLRDALRPGDYVKLLAGHGRSLSLYLNGQWAPVVRTAQTRVLVITDADDPQHSRYQWARLNEISERHRPSES